MANELEIIAAIRRRAAKQTERLSLGIGDDAAIIEQNGAKDLLACCDVSVENVHFRKLWMPPRLIGRKALAVTLSDIAAMGGTARFALVSIAIPASLLAADIDEVFAGIFDYADACDVAVIGGDTSSSPQGLFIDTIALGECRRGKAITRAGARPGDLLFVTGTLGAAELGWRFLERGERLQGDESVPSDKAVDKLIQSAIRKHLIPQPQLEFGKRLGEGELATAMIDVSDGLSTDLHHLLEESQCGAVIDAKLAPVADSVSTLAFKEFHIEPLIIVLRSGEEYELLFTVKPENREKVFALASELNIQVTAIGEITEGNELKLARDGKVEIIQPSGYEHKM
ncbi:MAG: thiamine-phosphate kinase [Acidobacteriota bacterium]